MSGQSMTCVMHNKSRTIANLEETIPGSGQYKCKHSAPCKVSARGGSGLRMSEIAASSGHLVIHPNRPERCAVHGKTRSPQQLWQVMSMRGPQWECLPEAK
eukprot:Sspe_Gene.113177::Locus_97123_Transcript_1_1_Confidence_1.000_Length_344::g.113177::m.113177